MYYTTQEAGSQTDFRQYAQTFCRCDSCKDVHAPDSRQPFFQSHGDGFTLEPVGSRCPECGSFDSTLLMRCGGCLELFEPDQLSKDCLCEKCEREAPK